MNRNTSKLCKVYKQMNKHGDYTFQNFKLMKTNTINYVFQNKNKKTVKKYW